MFSEERRCICPGGTKGRDKGQRWETEKEGEEEENKGEGRKRAMERGKVYLSLGRGTGQRTASG